MLLVTRSKLRSFATFFIRHWWSTVQVGSSRVREAGILVGRLGWVTLFVGHVGSGLGSRDISGSGRFLKFGPASNSATDASSKVEAASTCRCVCSNYSSSGVFCREATSPCVGCRAVRLEPFGFLEPSRFLAAFCKKKRPNERLVAYGFCFVWGRLFVFG